MTTSEPRQAGWCLICQENVWLLPQGGCEAGHDSSAIVAPYVAQPVAEDASEYPGVAAASGAKPGHSRRNALLIALGVVVVLALLALLAGLAYWGMMTGLSSLIRSTDGHHGDYVGTWAGKTEDGTVITLAVRNEGETDSGNLVVYDPTNPGSPRVKAFETDPEELTYVDVDRDPTGVLDQGFWLEDKSAYGEGPDGHLTLTYGTGSSLKSIDLTRVE